MNNNIRSEAYVTVLKQLLNNSNDTNEVIEEVTTKTSETKTLTDKSEVTETQVVSQKQTFKNGLVADYVNEILGYASKNMFLKVFTHAYHTKKINKEFTILSNTFVNKYYEYTKTTVKTAFENPLALFKEDVRDKLKWITKLIDAYKDLLARNRKLKRIVKRIIILQERVSSPGLSNEQRDKMMSKITKLNHKGSTVFFRRDKNLLKAFSKEVEELDRWLHSDNNYFKISDKDFGFLNVFVRSDANLTNVKVIHLQMLHDLIQNSRYGLELYKKAMEAHGFKTNIESQE
ncbi:hypothetical protein [Ureaplasma ceti]|uniref:Uncharacterized protein n=1 Tax=Ureaplasma ceti TaxID=3119530 RepID=A0ABP9U6A9_9BACT